jgi:hypothetical protein
MGQVGMSLTGNEKLEMVRKHIGTSRSQHKLDSAIAIAQDLGVFEQMRAELKELAITQGHAKQYGSLLEDTELPSIKDLTRVLLACNIGGEILV